MVIDVNVNDVFVKLIDSNKSTCQRTSFSWAHFQNKTSLLQEYLYFFLRFFAIFYVKAEIVIKILVI